MHPWHDETEPLMDLQSIERYYQMGDTCVRALDGVDLRIESGEFLMIVGSSGSGKSTLMHLLGCLDQPTAGRFFIRGVDIAGCPDERLSAIRNRRIGFIFQQFNLLSSLTVIENIALPLAYSGVPYKDRLATARNYAVMLGLQDRLDHRPTQLSGGQMQRVAIARALVGNPDILLADEPTGNLDSTTGREIMQILMDLNDRGLTIIMVTHDPDLADRGTRKVTVHDGCIIKDAAGSRPRPRIEANTSGKPPVSDTKGLGMIDLLRIGLKEGLLCHKMRTALTMLGIIIGVAAVIAMSSLSQGSNKKQVDQIRALGANMMRIIDKRLEGEAMASARKKGSRGLTQGDMDLIRANLPAVLHVAASREIKLSCQYDNRALSPRILGVAGDYLQVNNLAIDQGRPLSKDDENSSARVAILGQSIARQMGGDSAIGKVILLGGDPYRVVGVLANKQIDTKELEATSLTDSNYSMLLPLPTLLNRTFYLPMRNELDELQLQLKSEDQLYDVGTEIKRLLMVAHNDIEDFQIVIPLDLLKQKQQAQRLLDILTILISSISLVVGGIGIMNIMLAAVTERIREIGIRRAVGATRRDILYQFLSEAVLISITGGIFGGALALGATAIACYFLAIPFVVSPLMIGIAIGAAISVGLVFGSYPAAQAANKNPVEALRYE